MKKTGIGLALTSFFALGLLGAPHARAQLSNMMQGAMGGGGSGASGLGGMGGMSMPSLGSASPTNLAGVLQYCVQNNYLGGAANSSDSAASASSVKQSLLSKFTGSSSDPASNSGFTSGSNGVLDTGGGNSMSLGGSGLKQQMTQKICGQVLQHAQSLL